jgi:Skp family chaperone for outer membrane proteins
MKTMKYFTIVILFFVSSVNGAVKPLHSNIAVIDIYYLLDNSIAVQNLKKDMKSYNNELTLKLESKEKKLKSLEVELKNHSNHINPLKLEKEIVRFNKQVESVRNEIKQNRDKLELAYNSSMKQINDVTTNIVKRLSIKYSFNMVIPSGQIYYASPDIDITVEVVELLNKELERVEFKVQ